jgi:hypothetical protein
MRGEASLRLMSGMVLVGVFAAGALFGAALLRWTDRGGGERGDRAGERPPGPPPGGPIEAMTHELELDRDQLTTLRAIADAHRGELEAIARETQPKIRVVLTAIEDELVPKLRADQVQKLEAWRAHRPPPPVMPGLRPPGPPPSPAMEPSRSPSPSGGMGPQP